MDQKMNGLIDQRLEKLTDFVESCDSDWLKDGVEYEVPIERRRQNRHETRARVHLCATGVCIHAYSQRRRGVGFLGTSATKLVSDKSGVPTDNNM